MKQALTNLCPPATIEIMEDTEQGIILKGSATGAKAITTLAQKFREQRILQAVRQRLLKLVQNGSLIFGMQRQAAFMNRFHLCNLDDYSALGPIRVEIHAINIQDIIDYISPPTLKGKPQFRKDLKLE